MFASLKKHLALALVQVQGTTLYHIMATIRRPVVVITEVSGPDLERGIAELFGSEKRAASPSCSSVTCLIQSGDRTVGFGQLVYRSEESGCFAGFWIHGVYISPLYRRMGLGGELLREFILRANKQGAKEIFIQVVEANRPAIRMYEHAGFQYMDNCSHEMMRHLDTIFQKTGKRAIIMRLPLLVSG